MSSKVINLVDYQDKQRNIKEFIEWLEAYVEIDDVDTILVIFRKEDGLYYTCGSKNRNYAQVDINWDIDQTKQWIIESSLNNGDVDE